MIRRETCHFGRALPIEPGSVAKLNWRAQGGSWLSRGSDCDPEKGGNGRNLAKDVALSQPPDLPLANHVHRLNTLNRLPRRVKRPEASTRSYAAFDRPMILLHHIVEAAKWSTTA